MMRKINKRLVGRMLVTVPWERNLGDIEIVTASPYRGSATSPSQSFLYSQCLAAIEAVVRQQSFHLLSTQLPLRKQAFRVMLGLFISYKDVIRQINSADTQGCVFNGCVLPRLVISRQPLLQNHTLHPRPCIRNLTTSSSTVMKAYVSHRLGLSHLPASFDVGIHTEPLCKSLVRASVSFSSRLSMLSFAARRCIQIKRMCFCLRGADFHLSQSPLWLNSSWPWSTCPGLLL